MPINVHGIEYLTMGDAAFATNLYGTKFDIAAGYLASGFQYHSWSAADWKSAPGMKLPIWVGGSNGVGEAQSCLYQLRNLGVPAGSVFALDMEMRISSNYVSSFGAVMQHEGYKVWVYGSASTVFGNPQLNGYWVADYIYTPFMHSHMGTRATQWTDGPKFDQSTVKAWEASNLWS
jgi:hypothetical protein